MGSGFLIAAQWTIDPKRFKKTMEPCSFKYERINSMD